MGALLDQKGTEDLPLLSRQAYNFHLLSPGVIGMPTGTVSTTQFTFGGTERRSGTQDGFDDTQHSGNRQIRLIIAPPGNNRIDADAVQ